MNGKISKISEGAEARIYTAKLLGTDAVVKYRHAKGYRARELDEEIRMQRTRTEAKVQAKLYKNGLSVPPVLMVGRYWIAMGRISGTTMNRLLFEKGRSVAMSALNSERAMTAMEKAGMQLAMMHTIGIVHGDFTPANIMLDKHGRVWIIDFGLAEFTDSQEERALDVLLMKRSLDPSLYAAFEKGYTRLMKKEAHRVFSRLRAIEKRGRYQLRTLAIQN